MLTTEWGAVLSWRGRGGQVTSWEAGGIDRRNGLFAGGGHSSPPTPGSTSLVGLTERCSLSGVRGEWGRWSRHGGG